MVLNPWQRAIRTRRQYQNPQFYIAARRMAQQIAQPPGPPAIPAGYDRDRRLLESLQRPFDFDVIEDPFDVPRGMVTSVDSMYWDAEREMEEWQEFVKELKERKGK